MLVLTFLAGGWVMGGWVAGWLEKLKLMLPQPNLGWDLAQFGKKQTELGKKR